MTAFQRDGSSIKVSARPLRPGIFAVTVGDAVHEVSAVRMPDGRLACVIDGETQLAAVAPCGRDTHVRIAGRTWTLAAASGRSGGAAEVGSGVIEAPMTGTVLEVAVAVGDRVTADQTLVVLTAMKMEHRLTAGIEGVVAELNAEVGATVDAGVVLACVDADD